MHAGHKLVEYVSNFASLDFDISIFSEVRLVIKKAINISNNGDIQPKTVSV